MGGRGASRYGVSDRGFKYGTQYHTLHEEGHIKFVVKNYRHGDSLFESKNPYRVYVVTGGKDIKSVIFTGSNGLKYKSFGVDHPHEGKMPHAHIGYEHSEKGWRELNKQESKYLDKIKTIWDSYSKGK